MDQLWQRVLHGQHTALVGLSPGEPPASENLGLLRVSCDVPLTTLGPLLEARRKAELILDFNTPLLDQARQRLATGIRQKLLGELPARAEESALVEIWNRLAEKSPRTYAIVFESLDAADDATLDVLRRILSRPGWLKLPLVLELRKTALSSAAQALVDVLAASSPDAVIRAPAEEVEPVTERRKSTAPPAMRLDALPPDVLRVLRVGAVMGSGFEAELVAAILGVDPLLVLDALQRAADAGVALDDRGEGRFHLPDGLLHALRASMLPSFALLLHRRLAAILTAEPSAPDLGVPETARAGAPAPKVEEPAPAAAPPPDEAAAEEEIEREEEAADRAGPWPYAEIFDRAPTSAQPTEPAPAAEDAEATVNLASEPAPAPAPALAAEDAAPAALPIVELGKMDGGFIGVKEASPPAKVEAPHPRPAASAVRGDDARAAGHLAAAGDLEASAERYLVAAQHAASVGATAQAIAHGKKALSLLDNLPDSRKRRLLRITVLLEFGRLEWQAVGPDSSFTLPSALEMLDRARRLIQPDDPPALAAFAASLIAGVCYDLGDLPSLQRALEELTLMSRVLLNAGDAPSAARLLNDQAAVYIRMGDPVRATHLLTESRKIFEARAAEDPVAMLEMAETDHLFARIPLHVRARPGREGDALSMGLDHAIAAERTYRRLGDDREVARVWETMGRLELRKGKLDRALKRLSGAAEVQQRMGDLMGLARSTAALSEVLALSGRYREAAALLGESVALNFEKGSPIGLAFNRRALHALAERAEADGEAAPVLASVRARLDAAEGVLGQMKLPGEGD